LQTNKNHIAKQIRAKLPPEKQAASWGYLVEQFPWYPILHLLRAADHPNDLALLQKAGLYANDVLRLHYWLQHEGDISSYAVPENPIEENNDELEELKEEPLRSTEIRNPETELVPDTTNSANLPIVNPSKTTFFNSKDFEPGEPDDETDTETESPDPDMVDLFLPDLSKVLNQPVDENTPLLIEAYHTIDYFASQGIKVDKVADNQLNTQLDKQVKSFTDWLKTMKKASYQPKVTYTDPLVEVQAKSSLSNREVVTEAMAQVWAKQGNFTNAAKVYAKLMLLHPEKTPYFAARLQDLKINQ
jgi:hypothetical protein